MAFLDAATDRLERHRTAEFDTLIEATRAGTIFAHDQKAFSRWQRGTRKQDSGLSGAALESAVMGLARRNPEYVVIGP